MLTLSAWAIFASIIVYLIHRPVVGLFTALFSSVCDAILEARYPIRHIDSGLSLPSLPFIFPNGQGNVEKFLNGRQNSPMWATKYGYIYRLYSGFSPEVVLTQPQHIEEVFRDSHKHLKATANDSGYLMHQLLGDCLGLISGSRWKTLHHVTEPPFQQNTTLKYITFLRNQTRNYLSDLAKKPNHVFCTHGYLDPVGDLKLLPFLCVAELLYGTLDESFRQRLLGMIPLRESVFHTVIQGGLSRFKFSQYFPTQVNRNLWAFKSLWATFNDDIHAVAMKQEPSLRAPIIDMYAAVACRQITREELLQTLDEMLFANLDVTMGGLSWNLVFLASHKSEQSKLRNEIISTLTAECNNDNPSQAFYNLLLHKPNYLNSCIQESSRLRPLAAFSVPQSCPTSRTLSGYLIPAGTNFIVDTYALNIRNPFWGADSLTYRPERFLEREKKSMDMRYNYWRFGFGPRQCLGRYVVDLIMKILIAEMVARYELDMVRGSRVGNWKDTIGKGERRLEQEEWEFDKEVWIHHPQMRIKCVKREETIV